MERCGKWKRLLKKRELLAYYLLCREDGTKWNIGDAVNVLVNSLYLTRKTAFSVIRRLKRMNLLVGDTPMEYRCVGFLNYIEELYKNYICRKRKRLSPDKGTV